MGPRYNCINKEEKGNPELTSSSSSSSCPLGHCEEPERFVRHTILFPPSLFPPKSHFSLLSFLLHHKARKQKAIFGSFSLFFATTQTKRFFLPLSSSSHQNTGDEVTVDYSATAEDEDDEGDDDAVCNERTRASSSTLKWAWKERERDSIPLLLLLLSHFFLSTAQQGGEELLLPSPAA